MAADFFSRAGINSERDEPGFRITVAQVRAFLPRYKWVIAGVFVFTVLSAYGALSLMSEQYEAEAALLVKLGRENLDPPATAKNMVMSTGVRREEVGSEVQILRSADLLAKVVDTVGVEAFRVTRVPPPSLIGKAKFHVKAGLRWAKGQYQDALIALDLKKRLTEREQAVGLLQEQVVAEPQKDSDVISLRLRLADPQLAVRLEDTLIRLYLARRVEVRQNPGVKEFFDRETRALKNELDRAQAARDEWKRKEDLSVPSEQKALLLRQIRELSAERTHALAERGALTSQMAKAQSLASDAPERVAAARVETPNPSLQMLRERLTKLEADQARLLATYKPGAAPVVTADEEIASLRRLVGSQQATEMGSLTSEINPLRQQLQQAVSQNSVALEGITARLMYQDAQLTTLQNQLREIEASDSTLESLERERGIAEQSYLAASRRQQDADIERALDLSRITNVSIATPPAATLEPVAPRKLLIMAVALALGLLLGLATAILLEWMNDAVEDAESIESSTGLVCLGSFGPRAVESRMSRSGTR